MFNIALHQKKEELKEKHTLFSRKKKRWETELHWENKKKIKVEEKKKKSYDVNTFSNEINIIKKQD